MSAIFRKEFRGFFISPIGCIVIASMFGVAGFHFYLYNLYYGITSLVGVFSGLFSITLLAAPLLTMRLFSEEKRQRTDQALLTAPGSLTGIVVGKFLAALLLFIIAMSITLVFAVILAFKVSPDWSLLIGNYLGLLLVGGFIISIGTFISSLTESQLIAALGTIIISIVLLYMDVVAEEFSSFPLIYEAISFLSISLRFSEFTSGLVNYDSILYFLSIQALFLFLTVRVLDSKRWR